MFELNKLVGAAVAPLTFCLGMGLTALVCAGRRRLRWAVALAILSIMLLWVAATPLLAATLVSALEQGYPVEHPDRAYRADAIVVLGGALGPSYSAQVNMGGAADRIWHAADLYRAGKARWVIAAAGGRPVFADGRVEADAIAEMLVTLGVPQSAIRTERASRNTRENALLVRPLVQQLRLQRVLLVTSAIHMPRALKTFRKASPDVDWIPASADAAVLLHDVGIRKGMFPSASALQQTTRAIKEYVGLLALEI